ncbi:MAG TPA: Gfo/Idh/MocA family oxidoreductase [Sedimentisphaerales bacterium]|jgi:predicted dehydrogenase|nr:Gfo/Idh/MocA family oxidoreductase [Sedimentisphaerales bacterium]HNU30352.1 Gfo/Idh/MocA family oxidoreductase [Sedimentisphaerales bacterium]
MMSSMNRRGFLKRTMAATAGSYAVLSSFSNLMPSARGANNQVRVAVAGIRSRGGAHVNDFMEIEGVKVVALCDPDKQILEKGIASFKKKYNASDSDIEGYADIRQILDRKDVDALVIAAPNHWHSLMTVWACQAGKHVYVEKPVSHAIWEGRKMVEAARKYNRIVQAGTQHRSCPAVQEAGRDIRAGKYGKVLWVHCAVLSSRASIGKVTEPQAVPENIDYNLWAGPAPMSPVMRKSFHYDWHWQWAWGDGEMANWGIHYLDDVRHMLGWTSVPTKVVAAGNRFAWDDNGQTPNMHFALMDYDGLPLVVDIRNLPDPARRGGKEGALYLGGRGGNHIQCENGWVRISRGGGGAYDNNGQRIYQYKGTGGSGHTNNFINAVRSGRREDLAAEIEVGHLGTAICHQANIAWRVGKEASVDQVRESMKSHEDAANTLKDMLEQLQGNSVDLAKQPFVLGPMLTYDRDKEQFTGENAEQANQYIKCSYREPFVVRDSV